MKGAKVSAEDARKKAYASSADIWQKDVGKNSRDHKEPRNHQMAGIESE